MEAHKVRSRIFLMLIVLAPLVFGAGYAAVRPAPAAVELPAIAVVTGSESPRSPAARLVAELMQIDDFEWHPKSTAQAEAGLSDGSLSAAVVIPSRFGRPETESVDRQVLVATGRSTTADRSTAALVAAVSAAANRVGIREILVGLRKARADLGTAQLDAAVITTGVTAAQPMVTAALGELDRFLVRVDPMLSGAESLLSTLRRAHLSVHDLATRLDSSADSLRGMELTIGDIQQGESALESSLQQAADTVTATQESRAQIRAALTPVVNALRISGLPDGRRAADQATEALRLLGGPSDARLLRNLSGIRSTSAAFAAQLNDLSGLLGKRIDRGTRLRDVLVLGVLRLRQVETFLTEVERTAVGLLDQAKTQLPAMKGDVRELFQRFTKLSTELQESLHAGTTALPSGMAVQVGADPVAVESAGPESSDDRAAHAALIAFAGAFLIALAYPWSAAKLSRSLLFAVLAISVISVAGAAISISRPPGALSTFAILVLGVTACTALSAALLRILGDRIGISIVVALLVAAAVADIGTLPTGYIATDITAAAQGSGAVVMLTTTVLVGLLLTGTVGATVRHPKLRKRNF